MAIQLKTFIEGYKTTEVELDGKKWIFREPKIKDLQLPILELLEKNCIQGEWSDFFIFLDEVPISKQKELIDQLLQELGLA